MWGNKKCLSAGRYDALRSNLQLQIPCHQVDDSSYELSVVFLTVHSAAGIAGFLATSHVPMVHALLLDKNSRQDVMIYRLTL